MTSHPFARPAEFPAAGRARSWSWTSWRERRDTRRDDLAEVDALVWAWRIACAGVGIGREVHTVSGPTMSTPRLVHVTLGPPTVLVVELLPGQLAADVAAAADRIAPALGAHRLRVEARGHHHALVRLLDRDPLDVAVPVPSPALAGRVLLARDEHGRDVATDPAALPHLAVQGQTRSGKSTWLYGLLAQVAARPSVLVAGIDPTGLLLRPFAGSRHDPWQARGLGAPEAILAVLERLVAEMDHRVASLPLHADQVSTGPGCPLVLVVLEEWPGVLRALEVAGTRKLADRARLLVARLLAESHKAGYRVVLIAQRADASVIGGAERANLAGRITFRVDNVEAVRMLHPDAPGGVVAEHLAAPPGVALLTLPGLPLTRVRAPFLGTYRAFVEVIGAAGPELSAR